MEYSDEDITISIPEADPGVETPDVDVREADVDVREADSPIGLPVQLWMVPVPVSLFDLFEEHYSRARIVEI